LSLDNIKAALPASDEPTREQIDTSLKSLANVINDLRNYIFDLRPQALRDKGLFARLEGLLKELRVNTLLSIQANIDTEINYYLTDLQASHIFHIAHEALSNAARHARAKRITLALTREDVRVILRVEDDGIGFIMPQLDRHGHHGLANIQKRAAILEANLEIDSAPNRGTRLTLTLIGLAEPR
jgi:signal transduction histidine kinase